MKREETDISIIFDIVLKQIELRIKVHTNIVAVIVGRRCKCL